MTDSDYNGQPRFTFPGRDVLDLLNVETEPDPDIVDQKNIATSSRGSPNGWIRLPIPMVLRANHTLKLSVLMQGTTGAIVLRGGLKDGEIKEYKPPKGLPKRFVIGGSAISVILAIGLIASLFISHPTSRVPVSVSVPSYCATGQISIGGSTAILPLLTQVTQQYEATCHKATILINPNVASSEAGLSEVAAKTIQIGDSDLRSSDLGLVDHPIMVVPYVMVASIAIKNLTTSDIRDIYTGKVTSWGKFGDPSNTPITVVSRTSTSGTRKTFEQYILGEPEMLKLGPTHIEVDTSDIVVSKVKSIPGAIGYVDVGHATAAGLQPVLIDDTEASLPNIINSAYKFWTVEHMYTKGNPSGLTEAFLAYMNEGDIGSIREKFHYVNFNSVPDSLVTAHAQPLIG